MDPSSAPLVLLVGLIGLACVTLLTVALVWWRLTRLTLHSHQETARMLGDITAIAHTIAAQNRELLRRAPEP